MLAIIGGTGVDLRGADSPLREAREAREEIITTQHGAALVTLAQFEGREIAFLHRHANPDKKTQHISHHLPPHRVNYRANIAALKKLGVTAIFASTAVGSLRREWAPGTLILLDQFIDCTSGREKTFFDLGAVHVDVTHPYCPALRELLTRTAQRLNYDLQDGGTYLCANGPRFETPAEIRSFALWGADVVGMTGVPEATLAREANISYAGVSIATNFAAGISTQPLTQAEVIEAMKTALPRVVELFLAAARDYADDVALPSRNATAEFKTSTFDLDSFIV
ncbi:MAG TPA: MTAP family purine nucleoside phosphorylase [Abditibacteriaceae bacterium]|jgi:5'-methylthioadenosine phosphorylase